MEVDCNVALAGSLQIGYEVYPEELTPDIINLSTLIIDDELIIYKLIEAHLRHFGYTNIRFAYNGRSGLKIFILTSQILLFKVFKC
jgi:hypothetical protein